MTQSKSEQETHSTTNTEPWSVQQPYLTGAWSEAQNIYNQRQNQGPYSGNFVANDKSGLMGQSFNDAYGWATGQGQNIAGGLVGTGQNQLNYGTQAQANALNGLMNASSADNTQKNIDIANKYANAQDITAQTNAAMYDATRNVNENVLPGITRQAVASGNINSDRTALADGVVRRGLAEQTANTSAQLRANAYNQGLSMSQNQNQMNLSALSSAGTLGSQAAQQGYTGIQNGFNNYGSTAQMAQGAAYGLNTVDQMGLDNDLKKWYNNYQYPQQNLQDMYGIVGSNNWGGKSTTDGTVTTTQTPSVLQTIGQGMGMLGSFGSIFCDERLKHVLSGPVGSYKGHNTYLFTYRGDPSSTLHCFVMAQEVQKTHPEAVSEMPNGFLAVDISKL